MYRESGKGNDCVNVSALIPMLELGKWKPKWHLHKFNDPTGVVGEALKNGAPLEQFLDKLLEAPMEFDGNLLLNEGINAMWTLICGGSETAYNNTNARIGVGNSNTTAVATQTALIGGSTAFKAMDGGYPTYGTSQKATFRSTFGSSDGNFAWEEATIDNGASADKNLNRKVQSMGTKASGTSWVLTLDVTLS